MTDTLGTPLVHRLIESPVGALFENRAFERLRVRSLPDQFQIRRVRAAADVSLGSGPDAFLRSVGAPPAPHLHDRIERALARYARRRESYDDAVARWNDAFWGEESTSRERRTELERERRAASDDRIGVGSLFRFLPRRHVVPPLKFDLPDPDDASVRWTHELVEPETLYAVPEASPSVRRSRDVRGPGTVEYFLTFESPSPYVGDRVSARVYEPYDAADTGAPLPTLVFHSGFGSQGDLIDYWPEEEFVARRLAPRGYRVVLPDAPWHGRREQAGWFSGEPYLARAPVSMFQLYAAAAIETGVLVRWAREQGASAVGVGGLSLGGTVALHVAGWCGSWPAAMRPDLAVPVGAPGDIDETLLRSRLVSLLRLDEALDSAGWTTDRIREFAPVLNPPVDPGLDPSRVYPFVGIEDELAPYETARELFDVWEIPDENVTEWTAGHMGVLLRAIRTEDVPRTVAARLDDVAGVRRADDASRSTVSSR
jgi:pimeloyl-ACP methyl ester carboxylesterase